MKMWNKILLIEDFSALGGISMTTALSVFNALGIRFASIPTQLLSTQTEGFGTPHTLKLLAFLKRTLEHWKEIDETDFSTALVGYVGSAHSCTLIRQQLDKCKPRNVIIDPAMADNGQLYPSLKQGYISSVKKLGAQATILTPNTTELSLLSGASWDSDPSDTDILQAMRKISAGYERKPKVVVTDLRRSGYIYCCWKQDGQLKMYGKSLVRGHFYGAGDLFAAALTGFIHLNYPLESAIKNAFDATYIAILETSNEDPVEYKYGLNLKSSLAFLTQADTSH